MKYIKYDVPTNKVFVDKRNGHIVNTSVYLPEGSNLTDNYQIVDKKDSRKISRNIKAANKSTKENSEVKTE